MLASPLQRPWLLMIWSVAWQQSPCGSLPRDDRLIAAHLGMLLADFTAAREVLLRGWWVASDGRLYHDVLVDRTLEMLGKRKGNRERQGRRREAKGQAPERSKAAPAAAQRPSRPEQPAPAQAPAKSVEEMNRDELWSAGKSLLEASMPARQTGAAIGRLIKRYTDPVVLDAVRAACVERPADPMSYLVGVCERAAGQRPGIQGALEKRNFETVEGWASS
ncbi:MAG: hypothetical protein Q7U48_13670 [Hydrogenophaga sp.]|nr:hypothetical protein [Hydrogenophaga sp.]